MGQIEKTISVYERLAKREYKITVEDGTKFALVFSKRHYHHLVGYHYLTDIVSVANPPNGRTRFYRQLKNGKIIEEQIIKSHLFKNIEERVRYFSNIEDILSASDCKIIVDFDKTKADSEINAKYFLYKRDGNPLKGEAVTYYSLFIGYDDNKKSYYPATYIVEHSTKYINGQTLLNCKIEVVENGENEVLAIK